MAEDVKTASVCRNLRAIMRGALLDHFSDPKTVEVMVNPDGRLYVEKLGEGKRPAGQVPPQVTENIIRQVSGFHDQIADAEHAICEGEFPLDGSRFEGVLPPVAAGPAFSLRKKAVMVFTLQDYVRTGVMTVPQMELVRKAVRERRNILVVGGTGSGKTTLINAIIQEMVVQNPGERLVIIEDTGEIQCAAEDHMQLRSTRDISMTDLLRATLRLRPDRILVGEVRGPEALDLLDAWNTGHPGGCATLHANTAEQGLTRLNSLVSRNPFCPKESASLVAEAVDLVVNIAREGCGRRIRGIIEVKGYDADKKIYLYNKLG